MEVVKLWKETRKKLLSSFTTLKFGQINKYLVANMCAFDHHGIHLKFERTNILKEKNINGGFLTVQMTSKHSRGVKLIQFSV